MPADIDVLVGGGSPITFTSEYCGTHDYDASPVILTPQHQTSPFRSKTPPSPPTHFTFHGRCTSPTLRSVSSPALTLRLLPNHPPQHLLPVAVPRRPCLVRCDVLDLPTPSKHKKRVVFADDRGFPLTLVRTMSEPSNVPPGWSLEVVPRTGPEAGQQWEVTFPQPASDYLDFRRRLDTNNVSLENVILKEGDQSVVGTVKVRNLAFQKEVFVRTTSDDWRTQEDAFCTYVPNSPPAHGVTVLYDTFSFRLTLPPKSRKLEFCVCYRCSGVEYWDNHDGKNYSVSRRDTADEGTGTGTGGGDRINLSRRFTDDAKANARLESWTEFASWDHLNNDVPYW